MSLDKDRAKRALAVAVYNHYKRINFQDSRDDNDVDLQKSNILMIKPDWFRKNLPSSDLG